MNRLTIDRFEGSYAICELEDKSISRIPKYKLPLECREGDCLIINADGMYQIDDNEKQDKKKRISEKLNRLFE